MKNLFKVFVPVAAAAIAFVSCQQENIDPNAVTIRVHAAAEELRPADLSAAAAPDSKTYIGTYQGQANTILWGTGEYMKLALGSGDAPFTKDNTAFGKSSDSSADAWNGSNEAEFEFSITPKDANAASFTLMGLYPASAFVASNNDNPQAVKVNLPATQNATANSYDPAAYIMVAKPESFTTVPADWVTRYRRATALNKVTLKNLPAGVSIKRVKITTPAGKYLAGGRHINLSTGESGDIYNGGGRTETVEVKYATALSGSGEGTWNADVWFTSWDLDLGVGETLTIVAYTTNQKSYTKEITVPSGKSIKFQEGCLNTMGATGFNSITPENVTELEEGNYVVLAKDGDNYYALKAEKEDNKQRLLSVAYEGSVDSYLGDADIIWSLTKSGDSFIFENDSKYLGYKGSSNESYWLEADENWTTTNYLLDVTAQQTAGLYYVTLHSNSSRYLSKNSSDAFFAFYGNTSQKADIVFVPATVDTRTVVTLSFAEDAIAKTTANYSEFTGQVATSVPNVAAITGNITYAISGDAIGTVDASTGAVTLNGSTTGSATVTATFGGDETYRPAEASYTISVSAASGPQYELVSAANDVVAGDYIITWNNSYYLVSGSTSGTNPAVGTGITVASNRITNTVTSDMVWTFTGDNTNGFTISDGTNILHSTNSAQGISINTTSTRKWTVSVDDTKGMVLHGDDGGSRYLAVYNSATWRYYGLDNNYSGTLRLYKLLDSRPDAPISWSASTGTATWNSAGISSTLPSLSNTEALTVSYASSEEGVATIAGDGTVTIVGGGSTVISAIYDGSANNSSYKTTTVSYTLTVTDNRTACATPSFSPVAGEVESGDVITITSATAGATIYYTTGNSEFSAGDWTEYTAPVAVSSACTIKAIAVKANYLNSAVTSAAYSIAAAASTIAQVLAGGANTYTINNILVYSVVGKQVIVGDSSAKMVLFKDGHGLEVGDNISIPAATVAPYNGILQIQDGTFNENSNGNVVDHGTATNLNDASVATSTLSTFSASGYHAAQFVTMNGTQSGRNINGTNATLYLSAANTTYDGQAVTVTGYIYYYNSNYSNYNFQLVSIAPDESTPTISVSPSSLSWAAAETDSKTLTVTLNGAAAVGDYGYSVTSGTAGDWNISNNGSGTITVSPKAANTSTTDAKSITLRISHADVSTVYQDVTCTQAKASGGNTYEYSFTISTSDFNTTSYAANNSTSHSSTATCTTDNTKTIDVTWASNQVMQQSSVMQWQKNTGYIYNVTDLGTIKSVTVNSTAGTFTTYYGTSSHPTSGTTVGNGFFTVAVGSATGKTSSVVVVFEK